MPLSDWKSTASDGTLPNKALAGQFQYKRALIWNVPLFGFGAGFKVATGTWHIQLKNGETVIFEQTVALTLQLISIGFTGGLQLFTWQFQKEVITTPIIGGAPTGDDNPSWSYTIGATDKSEFGILVPGGGSDYTDVEATIIAEWQSPVYRMNVPTGTKLHIVTDHWGLGSSSRPEWQFRFKDGFRRMLDTATGFFGELVSVRGQNGNANRDDVEGGHSWPAYNELTGRGTILGAHEPSLVLLPDGRDITAVLQDDGYWEYESYDSQRTWQKVGYPVSGEVAKKTPEKIFDASVQMPQMIQLDTIRLAVARRGSTLVSRRISDEGFDVITPVSDSAGDGTYSLNAMDDGKVQICDDSGKPVFQSLDSGLSWGAA